jgi:hypothetical protein
MQSSLPNITIDNNTRFIVNNNGESVPYNNRNMSSPHDAFKAVVDVLNAHSADMFHVILRVISNKYGHSFDDMLDTITSSNEYANLQTNPLLQSLSYFDQSDVDNITQSTQSTQSPQDDTDSLSNSICNMNISDNNSDNTSDNPPVIPNVLITKKRKPKTISPATSAIIPLAIPPPETITIRKKGKKSTQTTQ